MAMLTGAMAVAGGILGGYAGGRLGAAVGAGIGGAAGLGVSSKFLLDIRDISRKSSFYLAFSFDFGLVPSLIGFSWGIQLLIP